jgi:hypothetical protein
MKKQYRGTKGKYAKFENKAAVIIIFVVALFVFSVSYSQAIDKEEANLFELRYNMLQMIERFQQAEEEGARLQLEALESARTLQIEQKVQRDLEEKKQAEKRFKEENSINSLTPAEREIIRRESSFRVNAKNPNSTAFGLWQGLKATRVKYASKFNFHPDTVSEHEQIIMFRDYVKDRYQTAEKALEHHNLKNWY